MQRRNVILGSILTTVVAVGLVTTGLIWRHRQSAALALAGVPVQPDLSRWPPELAQQIARQSLAVKESSSPVEPLAALVALYWANGFTAEAERTLGALRKIDPQNAHWPYLLADLRLRAGDAAGAVAALQATVERDASYAPAWIRLGEMRLKTGASEQARACFSHALAVAPENLWAEYDTLVFEAQHGGSNSIRGRVADLLRVHPDLKELHGLMADLLVAAHNPDGAALERRLANASELNLNTSDPWRDDLARYCYDSNRLTARALEVRREGRFDETEKLLNQAVRLAPFAPANPLVWDLLANFYLKTERTGEARATLEAGMAAFPDEPEMPLLLTRLLCTVHQPDAAIAMIQPAIRRWPELAELHAALGQALQDAGNFTAAAASFREAIRLDPTLTEAQFHFGVCLLELGDRAAAHAAIEQTIAMRPDHPEALYALAALDLEAGDFAAAEANVMKVYAHDPEKPEARRLYAAWHLRKGMAAAQAGDLNEASQHYRTGLTVDPDFALLLREAGALAEQTGRWNEAVKAFTHLLEVKPADLEAYLSLSGVLQKTGNAAEAKNVLESGLRAALTAGDQAQAEEFKRQLRQSP